MAMFVERLRSDLRQSGKTRADYARGWDLARNTLNNWLSGVSPARRFHEKINARFPGAFEASGETITDTTPARRLESKNGVFVKNRISLASRSITELVLIFEWLVFKASPEERNRFRDELGEEWEWFMNLARSLVNEKSLQVMKDEGRLNIEKRGGL